VAAIALLGCYLIVYALFWLPASILVRALVGQRVCDEFLLDLLTLVFALIGSYAVFWVYVLDPRLGIVVSGLLLACAAMAIVFHRWIDDGPLRRHVSLPVRTALLFGLLYLGGLSLFGGLERVSTRYVPNSHIPLSSCYFWVTSRAGDEMIPLKFAEALANSGPLRGPLLNFPGGWQFSDRPPLQSAVLLAFWPLMKLGHSGIVAQAVGTMLQVQWVVAMAALGAALGWGRRRTGFVLLLIGLSGFAYYNSTYVWPKLLAAALALAAAAPLAAAWRRRRALTNPEIVLSASAAALSMLSHGSTAFSLIPVALLALVSRRFTNVRTIGLAVLVAATLYLPWAAYQKFVDPPGDRCARWTLAGRTEADGPPLGQCLREAYARVTLPQWLTDRAWGLVYLVCGPELDANIIRCVRGILDPRLTKEPFGYVYFCKPTDLAYNVKTLAALLRYDQVEQTFRALGVLNIAWPLLLWGLVRRRRLGSPGLGLLLLGTAMGVVLWWLLLIQPLFLIIRNSSYAMMLGLLAAAAVVVYDLPPRPRWLVAGLHLVSTAVLWVWFVPTDFARVSHQLSPHVRGVPLVAALAALAGVFYYCLRRKAGYRPVSARQVAIAAPTVRALHARELAWGVGLVVAFLLVAGAGVYRKSPLGQFGHRSGWTILDGLVVRISPADAEDLALLFDGIADRADNYGVWSFREPLLLEFREPQRFQEIRMHLFDEDKRSYRFLVEGLYEGQWRMLLDRSQQAARGRVDIALGGEPMTALRVTGLYNSNQELDPNNTLMHVKELELIRPPVAKRR
jgi:hypothetical protein